MFTVCADKSFLTSYSPKIGIITGGEGKIKSLEEKGFKVDFILKKPFNVSELTENTNNIGIKDVER
jgi:hypothetical protein